jgi:hypothetical protein
MLLRRLASERIQAFIDKREAEDRGVRVDDAVTDWWVDVWVIPGYKYVADDLRFEFVGEVPGGKARIRL